jgi:hypothetical protein
MVKKACHILLSMIVFLSTTGFTINQHYCGKTFYKTTIDYQTHCCKGHCKTCHNRTVVIKIKNEFFGHQLQIVHPASSANNFLLPQQNIQPSYESEGLIFNPGNPPPGKVSSLSFLRTFRI